MKKRVIIGIDVGGSTTKIVGFDVTDGGQGLIDPLFVRATDPITSIYGAFGKFTSVNDLSLTDIEKVMITGVGSSHVTKPLYDLPCVTTPEFHCIGNGGLYLSRLDRALIASLGTGTAMVYSVRGEEPKYLGGTGVGGGTVLGLSKKMLGMDNIDHIAAIAEDGDLTHVDLTISDLTKHDIVPGFSDVMTASNFGNVSDIATKSDIAYGLLNLVYETIGMVARFAAMNYGLRDIVLTGNLATVKTAETVFGKLNRMFDLNFIIPPMAQFSTVIGAALSGCPQAGKNAGETPLR